MPDNYFGNAILLGNFTIDTLDLVKYDDPMEVIIKVAKLSRQSLDKMSQQETIHEQLAFRQGMKRQDAGIAMNGRDPICRMK